MSTKLYLTGMLLMLLAASCSEDPFRLFGKTELLINSWADPYETNCEGGDMFLIPAGSACVKTGERNRLDLMADGSAKFLVASPRDPHIYDFITNVNGSWRFDPGLRVLQILDTNGKIRFTFQVHSIEEDELVLSYLDNADYELPK